MTPRLKTGVAVGLSLAVIALFFAFSNPFVVRNAAKVPAAASGAQLFSQDENEGAGIEAKTGDVLSVHYTGKLQDGTVFDTSVGKKPFQFVLGAGKVIPGWDQGLIGMKAGGKRLLVVPPDLAYGQNGYGPIPGNATLIFEVELLAITPAPEVQQ